MMGDSLLNYAGEIHGGREKVMRYFFLEERNKQLTGSYDSLSARYNRLLKEVTYLRASQVTDSLGQLESFSALDSTFRDSFELITARVIRNSTHLSNNYLVIDKGQKEGIEIDLGVVAPQGVVGRVVGLSESYALVQSAINTDFKTPVVFQKKDATLEGNLGIFSWQGGDMRYGRVNYIPETASLKQGDRALTSSSSTVFPPGFPVGVLEEENPSPREGFYDLEIKLSVDFSALSFVYVVRNPVSPEIDSLYQQIPTQ